MGRKVSRVVEQVTEQVTEQFELWRTQMEEDNAQAVVTLDELKDRITHLEASFKQGTAAHAAKMCVGARVRYLRTSRVGVTQGSEGIVIPRPHGYPVKGNEGDLVWVLYLPNRTAYTTPYSSHYYGSTQASVMGHYAHNLEVLSS